MKNVMKCASMYNRNTGRISLKVGSAKAGESH